MLIMYGSMPVLMELLVTEVRFYWDYIMLLV